ncbi:MAM and LDL-receptor class A domain-containing protein 1-like, partial [Saccostrea cucullata]|uniref:MAM and LDL-receptor class A domain-containing protein 1-like n=1 Tax=Saccostrea cuccullata TaxID=36930 RepID=UPI002ED67695
LQIVLEGIVGNGYYGDIAIDDISLTPGCQFATTQIPGVPTPAPTLPGACGANKLTCGNGNCYSQSQKCNFRDDCGDNSDEVNCGTSCKFESGAGLCGWHNSLNDNLDWKLLSGPTPSKNTGPQNDHTLGTASGHYLYVESSNPAHPQDKALLESAVYYQSGPLCNLTFWYNMNGQQIGTLQVLLKTSISNQLLTLWQKTGNQGPAWKQASIPIRSQSQFAIIFEARTGFGYLGDIAIDDIMYTGCDTGQKTASCLPSQFMCTDQTMCIDRRYRCDEKVDCSDGSDEDNCRPFNGDCSFETSLSQCEWTQSDGDDGDWTLAQTTINGPKRDHRNTATGHFIFMDSSKQNPGDVVRIQTPFFPASHGVCYMRFWYYMFGSPSMGPLKVFLQNRYGNTTDLFWEMSGSQGQKWKNVNIPLGSAQDFSVIFEATRGDQDHSDIAIDDVSFTPECETGVPAVNPSHTVCYQGTFYCAPKKQCYPNSWKCDGVADCPDGSDEPSTCPATSPATGPTQPPVTKSLVTTPAPPTTTTQKIKNTCAQGKFQCNDGTCIPLLLLCDAVADCPDGSDEVQNNCPIQKCDVGFYYCKQQRQCINGTRCDNNDDCGDMTDESVCGAACPPNFCQSGSVCQKTGVQTLSCSCPAGLTGIRCQYQKSSTQRHTGNSPSSSSSSGWKAGVGVTVGLVAVIAIVLGGYFLWRRQRARNLSERLGIGLENPSYDGGDMHDFHMNAMEDPYHGVRMTSDATSIENPLYQDVTA